jgi:hypothetical protein
MYLLNVPTMRIRHAHRSKPKIGPKSQCVTVKRHTVHLVLTQRPKDPMTEQSLNMTIIWDS